MKKIFTLFFHIGTLLSPYISFSQETNLNVYLQISDIKDSMELEIIVEGQGSIDKKK